MTVMDYDANSLFPLNVKDPETLAPHQADLPRSEK